MSDYVDMSFVNHPEISAVFVEHLIKTRVLGAASEVERRSRNVLFNHEGFHKLMGQDGIAYGKGRVGHQKEKE
jgi:hypothetical protein